jgi:long-chain acyl-CoA synthetase
MTRARGSPHPGGAAPEPNPLPNLASLLVDHPFADGEPLLHSIDATLTAGEARALARRVAADLEAAGVRPGQAVAVRMPNVPETVATFAGVWLTGAVVVPVNPRLPEPEVARIVDVVRPAAVVSGERGGSVGPGVADPSVARAGVAVVLWTSGTTGRPKPIVHTHAGYLELVDRVLGPLSAARDRSKRPAPNLVPVGLTLNAGVYNMCFGLRAGAELVVMDRFDTATFATLVRRFAIRSTVLPPAAITMLNDDPAITDLAPLRYVRSITAPLSPLQARRFTQRFGVFVLNGYGQAELGEVIGWTAADARDHPDKLGAAGRPHPGVEVRIADGTGAPVTAGEVGHLLVRAAAVATEVAGAELRERLDADGFLDTGDLARVDADGFVWIEGRASDVVNRGGNKVFPDEVEEVLRLDPAVRDAAVAGAPDQRLGQVPVAFVVPSGTEDAEPAALAERLVALCRAHLAPYKVPVAFHVVDALPRSEVGKVLRRALVEEHLGRMEAR